MPRSRNGLTLRQRAFAQAYLSTANGNGAEAARQAGYSEGTAKEIASESLTKPHVIAYMAELAEQAAEIGEPTQELVQQALLREGRTAKQDGARVRAWELVGKSVGMFAEQPAARELDDVSVADLRSMLAELEQVKASLPQVDTVIDQSPKRKRASKSKT